MKFYLATLALMIMARTTVADSDDAKTYDLVFDASHRPHPQNPKTDEFVDGDSLVIHVDPTRLFPDPNTKTGDLGFAVTDPPPEVLGFYVAGPGAGSRLPLSMQSGPCPLPDEKTEQAATKARDDAQKAFDAVPANADASAKQAAKDALGQAQSALDGLGKVAPTSPSLRCVEAIDWKPVAGAKGYVCGAEPLTKMLDDSKTWSLVKATEDPNHVECVNDWTFSQKGSPISSVIAEVIHGGNEPERVVLAADNGRWSATIAIKANTRAIRLTITKVDKTETTRTIPIKAQTRDTHSRLRIQGELLATNRLRAVSFAVALTPVRREFFTKGTGGCVFGCAVTLSALLRISGDEKTVVQFGGGVGVNFVRSFQINGGLLLGTADTNTAWRIERSWFVGVAIDPIILSEAISTGSKKE